VLNERCGVLCMVGVPESAGQKELPGFSVVERKDPGMTQTSEGARGLANNKFRASLRFTR
jgi:hypothetical protein